MRSKVVISDNLMTMKAMRRSLFILSILAAGTLRAQLVVQPQATLSVGSNASVSVLGGVSNEGSFQNLGEVTFTGDWSNTNIYNDGGTGMLEANGMGSQLVSNNDQSVGILDVNTGTEITILGNTFEVMDELILNNGIVRLGSGTSLVINENATISGGSIDSFVEGTIVQRGGGVRRYPLGIEDFYLPLELLDISDPAGDLEMSVGIGLFSDANAIPNPTGSVITVSEYHYWQLNTITGTFNGSMALGSFDNADLTIPAAGAPNHNEFNFANSNVSLVQSSALDGDYTVVERDGDATNTDLTISDQGVASATFGTLLTSDEITDQFVAIGLVADTNEDGILYVPTAFSPSASNVDDQRFRIFGDRIVDDETFKFVVYNSFGVEVYSADSFADATETGWDGINRKTNNEEPMGSYRYFIQWTNTNDVTRKRTGVVLLIR